MTDIIISSDDMLDMNIRVARDLVIEANSTPYKDTKLKSLLMANRLIETCLTNEGVDLERIRIKKKKNKEKN